jgi:hypothetical protein
VNSAPPADRDRSCRTRMSLFIHADRTALEVLPGGAPDEARLDAERWIDEGGSFDREIPAPLPAADSG